MTLYHGSERIIETPQFGVGNPRNDYGVGFYCTQHLELAKEWACQKNMDGFANEYELDLLGLSVLDVSGAEYTILHWLCILMQNRIFIPKTSFGKENLETLLAKYKLDYERFDVICGYRANDSYFTFASDFLENVIPIQHLATSMKLGELGMQVVLKSPKAFSQLMYTQSFGAEKEVYFQKYRARDSTARKSYFEGYGRTSVQDAIYLVDIFRNPELLHGIEL